MWENKKTINSIDEIQKSFKKIQEKTKVIESKIQTLDDNVEANALLVKEDIDAIFKNPDQNDFLKWTDLKISLLKIKLKALSKLWELDKTIYIYDEIYQVINNELSFSIDEDEDKEAKKEMIRENSIEKFNLIINNSWIIFDSNKNIIPDEKNKLESIFLSEINKLKEYSIEDIWVYYLGLFYARIWNGEKAEEYIEKAAVYWNKEAIYLHLWVLTEYFINFYNSLEIKDKVVFKNANILMLEKEYSKFKKTTPELHEKLWIFFEEINEYKRARQEYLDWIKLNYNWAYKLNYNLAQLYKNNSLESKDSEKSALLFINKLFEFAEKNNDNNSLALSNEFYWDISKYSDKEKSNKYYISSIINKLYYYKDNAYDINKLSLKIQEKELLSIIRLFRKSNNHTIQIENITFNITEFFQVLINIDTKYILMLAQYYWENWHTADAFINYMHNYSLNLNKESFDAVLMFLETTLFQKIDNEIIDLNTELFDKKEELEEKREKLKQDKEKKALLKPEIKDLKFYKESIEWNIHNLKIDKTTLEEIVKIIEKYESIKSEDIEFILSLTLGKDFYENLSFEKVYPYFMNYQNDFSYSSIYLTKILKEIESLFWYDINILEWFFKMIEEDKPFTNGDLDNFRDIINSSLENIDKYNC